MRKSFDLELSEPATAFDLKRELPLISCQQLGKGGTVSRCVVGDPLDAIPDPQSTSIGGRFWQDLLQDDRAGFRIVIPPLDPDPQQVTIINPASSLKTFAEDLRRDLREPWVEAHWVKNSLGAGVIEPTKDPETGEVVIPLVEKNDRP